MLEKEMLSSVSIFVSEQVNFRWVMKFPNGNVFQKNYLTCFVKDFTFS